MVLVSVRWAILTLLRFAAYGMVWSFKIQTDDSRKKVDLILGHRASFPRDSRGYAIVGAFITATLQLSCLVLHRLPDYQKVATIRAREALIASLAIYIRE